MIDLSQEAEEAQVHLIYWQASVKYKTFFQFSMLGGSFR